MIKMNLFFDDVKMDNVYAHNMAEAFEMKDTLADFEDQNGALKEFWKINLKKKHKPRVHLKFDKTDYLTLCWVYFDKITDWYSYEYTIIDNTIIFDSMIAGNVGLIKIGKNDIFNGHFECSTIEEALIKWYDILKITNKESMETDQEDRWAEEIKFIESILTKTDKKITKEMVDDLNAVLKNMHCAFKFKFNEPDALSTIPTIEVIPANSIFIESSIINLASSGHAFIRGFFNKRGIELNYNNTGTIMWAKN